MLQRNTPKRTRRVAMLIYSGVAPMDVAGPLQVFELCNIMRGETCYDVVTVAPDAEPVHCSVGITYLPSCAMDDLVLPVDLLLVAGGADVDAGARPQILQWLRQAAPGAGRLGSICTGAFILGAAGLLDGKRATTHWMFADQLAARYPEAEVEVDAIYIKDGNTYSSAGISAGIDLALALVEEDYGRSFALEVARHMVLYLKRSGGQVQFSTVLRSQTSELPVLRALQDWCMDHLNGDLSAEVLAERASMSQRSLFRMFQSELGLTPKEYVMALRLSEARRMLEDTGISIVSIGQRCGFGSASNFRRVFASHIGISPAQFRRNFHPDGVR